MTVAAGLFGCVSGGGIVVFPADTVYGIGCDPEDSLAVERLYLLKRRERDKPCAVMFFDIELAVASLPELGPRIRDALLRLLPGPIGVLLPNPAERFPLACGADRSTLGLRVPALASFGDVRRPVLQSSANRAGQPDPRVLEDVPELMRAAADLVIDGGQLPGTPSTIVDLRRFERDRNWSVVRVGAVPAEALAEALGDEQEGQFQFDPRTYAELVREEIPAYEQLQDELVGASGTGARAILELGTGTGETAARLLDRHRDAKLVGIDENGEMLRSARAVLAAERAELRVTRLQDPLPAGQFDLVASALCVHHLAGAEKRDLFRRVRDALRPGGRFVLADVVIPRDSGDAITPLTHQFDRPDTAADQLQWIREVGLDAEIVWEQRDLAVICGELVRGQ